MANASSCSVEPSVSEHQTAREKHQETTTATRSHSEGQPRVDVLRTLSWRPSQCPDVYAICLLATLAAGPPRVNAKHPTLSPSAGSEGHRIGRRRPAFP